MPRSSLLIASVALCLTGCGSNGERNDARPQASQPGKVGGTTVAPAGQVNSVAYPGSQVTGDTFATRDPIDRVLDWYWGDQPMRQRDGVLWTVSKPEKRGESYLVQLTLVGDGSTGQSYAVYLDPASGGGTAGRIRPITAEEIRSGVQL